MKRLTATLEEKGNVREIPPFELNVLAMLDSKKKYDFHLYDDKGRHMLDHKNASSLEVASYFPGIRETMQFNEKYGNIKNNKLMKRYKIEIKEAH